MDTDIIPDNERRYTPKAIADGYNVNPRTVHRWIAAGMPAVNVGSSLRPDWRVRLSDVTAWLAEREGLMRDTVDLSDD